MSDQLFDAYKKSEKSDWLKAAQIELKGQNPYESLQFMLDGLPQIPYYDSSDGQKKAYELDTSNNLYLGPRSWYNLPEVFVVEEDSANKYALEHLNQGADGILFHITSPTNLNKLLKEIELPYCMIIFMVHSDQYDLLTDFAQYVYNKGYQHNEVSGAMIWDSLNKNICDIACNTYQDWKKFRPLGIAVDAETEPVSQVSSMLHNAYEAIKVSNSAETFLDLFAISIYVNTHFFIEIAKMKAMRQLWDQIAGGYGVIDTSRPLFIHGISSAWKNDKYEPNGNMIKATTAAASAVLGGCDAITISGDEKENSFKNRIARNVLTLLREESKLNVTADATAGSYYLENLSDQIANEAWLNFQKAIQ